MAKGKNETVEDYTARAVQFKKDFFRTKEEIKQPEFVRKWRQGFGIILAPINLAIDDLLQDPPMWRDDVPLFQLMETAKGAKLRLQSQILQTQIIIQHLHSQHHLNNPPKHQIFHKTSVLLKLGIGMSRKP